MSYNGTPDWDNSTNQRRASDELPDSNAPQGTCWVEGDVNLITPSHSDYQQPPGTGYNPDANYNTMGNPEAFAEAFGTYQKPQGSHFSSPSPYGTRNVDHDFEDFGPHDPMADFGVCDTSQKPPMTFNAPTGDYYAGSNYGDFGALGTFTQPVVTNDRDYGSCANVLQQPSDLPHQSLAPFALNYPLHRSVNNVHQQTVTHSSEAMSQSNPVVDANSACAGEPPTSAKPKRRPRKPYKKQENLSTGICLLCNFEYVGSVSAHTGSKQCRQERRRIEAARKRQETGRDEAMHQQRIQREADLAKYQEERKRKEEERAKEKQEAKDAEEAERAARKELKKQTKEAGRAARKAQQREAIVIRHFLGRD